MKRLGTPFVFAENRVQRWRFITTEKRVYFWVPRILVEAMALPLAIKRYLSYSPG